MERPSTPSDPVLIAALRGMARLQARHEMLECIVRALIVETPPVHPLFWKALDTARSDWSHRQDRARDHTPPEIEADALALWNVLREACAPPAGNQQPGEPKG